MKKLLKIITAGLMINLAGLVVFSGFVYADRGWLPDYKFSKAIGIFNQTKKAIENYQVKIANPVYDESTLLAAWHFDTVINGYTPDSSGKGKNAAILGAAKVEGKFGSGLSFNGRDSYVDCGNAGGVRSIEFYIKDTSFTDGVLELNPKAYISLTLGKVSVSGFSSPKIYVNGDLRENLGAGFNHVVINTDTPINANAVKIGVANSKFSKGIIDEVKLYEWPLKASDVQARYNAKVKSNYDDIRFTDSDGSGPLNYWMEKDGVFWVNVPLIPKETNKIIYVYYGNKGNRSLSNGRGVFNFFEDFENGNMGGWTANGWNISVDGARGAYSASSNTNKADFQRPLSLASSGMRLEISGNISGDPAKNSIEFYENGVLGLSWQNTGGWLQQGYNINSLTPVIKFFLKSDGKNTAKVDEIFLRKYIDPEPGVSLYVEQGSP